MKTKICEICKTDKSIDLFKKHSNTIDGYHSSCKSCENVIQSQRETKEQNKEYKECIKCGKFLLLEEFRTSCYALSQHCESCKNNTTSLFKSRYERECSRCHHIKNKEKFPRRANSYLYPYCYECMLPEERVVYELAKEKRRENNRKYLRKYTHTRIFYAAKQNAKRKNVPFGITKEDIIVPEFCPVFNIPLIQGDGIATDNSPSIDEIIPGKGYVKGNIMIISWKANRLKSNAKLEDLEKIVNYMRRCSA